MIICRKGVIGMKAEQVQGDHRADGTKVGGPNENDGPQDDCEKSWQVAHTKKAMKVRLSQTLFFFNGLQLKRFLAERHKIQQEPRWCVSFGAE